MLKVTTVLAVRPNHVFVTVIVTTVATAIAISTAIVIFNQ